jgi:hypothetical protein
MRTFHLTLGSRGHLLAAHVAPACDQERAAIGMPVNAVQMVNKERSREVDRNATTAQLAVYRFPLDDRPADAQHGFCFLPWRWLAERPSP